MDPITTALQNLSLRIAELGAAVLGRLPELLGSILLVLTGWLVARFVRSAIRKLGARLNRGLDQMLPAERASRLRLSPAMLRLIGTAAFWIILLLFLRSATGLAGFEGVSEWLGTVLHYLPTLLFGVMIIVAGHLIGLLVRDLLLEALASANVEQRELIARLAQSATFLTALIIGIHQVGVNISFVTLIISVALGAVLLGFSLAFGLGARPLVENLIGSHYLRRHYAPGALVRIGDIQGEVVEVTPTHLVIDTREGRSHVPARCFSDQPSDLLRGQEDE